jgi:low temperature requirement protein LtrA
MKGLVVPDVDEDFTADQVELYFDLAFVFAFAQVVAFLHKEHTVVSVGKSALLFIMIWLAWSQFTWSANALSSSGRVTRLLMLVATIATIPMGASVQTAFGGGGLAFSLSMVTIMVMALTAMMTSAPDVGNLRQSVIVYALPTFVSLAVFTVGGFLDGQARITAWILAVLVFIYSLVRAGQSEWIVRPGHFAERHGLILIVALGEVIVAIGIPVVDRLTNGDGRIGAMTASALVLSGILAGLLFWSYFDRFAPALEHRTEELTDRNQRGRLARDAYTVCHLFIVGGVILTAAALEEVTLNPDEPLDAVWRWMLFIGLSSFLLGVVVAVYRTFGVIARERIIAVVILAVLLPIVAGIDGLAVLLLVDFALLGMVVTEHLRVEERVSSMLTGRA